MGVMQIDNSIDSFAQRICVKEPLPIQKNGSIHHHKASRQSVCYLPEGACAFSDGQPLPEIDLQQDEHDCLEQHGNQDDAQQ